MEDDRPIALVTAPLRGPALERLHALADVVIDPWIDHTPIRLLGPEEPDRRVVDPRVDDHVDQIMEAFERWSP